MDEVSRQPRQRFFVIAWDIFISKHSRLTSVRLAGQRPLCSRDKAKIGNCFLEKHKTIPFENME